MTERESCGEKCSTAYAIDADWSRFLQLSPFPTARTGKHYSESLQGEKQAFQIIVRIELGKGWLDQMSLNVRQKRDEMATLDENVRMCLR